MKNANILKMKKENSPKLDKKLFTQIGFNQFRQKVVYCFKRTDTGKIMTYDNHSQEFQEFDTLTAMKQNYENKFGAKKEWFWNSLNPRLKKSTKKTSKTLI